LQPVEPPWRPSVRLWQQLWKHLRSRNLRKSPGRTQQLMSPTPDLMMEPRWDNGNRWWCCGLANLR